jgi:hypothetical protein
MNIQVNKDQLERVLIKWLNMYFGNLTPKKHKHYPNSVFYVNSNKDIIMEYNKETEDVYIDYNQIWSKIESLFHLNYFEVQSIMSIWLKDTYKLEGVKCEAQWG